MTSKAHLAHGVEVYPFQRVDGHLLGQELGALLKPLWLL